MVKALWRESAKAAEHFGVATQIRANGVEWPSRNDGDQLVRTCEGVLEVRKWLVAPEPERRANGKPTKATEVMDRGTANAAANGC